MAVSGCIECEFAAGVLRTRFAVLVSPGHVMKKSALNSGQKIATLLVCTRWRRVSVLNNLNSKQTQKYKYLNLIGCLKLILYFIQISWFNRIPTLKGLQT
jgi:hypothetical protein